MNTNRFAQALLNAIKEFLTWIGLPREILDTADEIIFLILIVAIAFIVAVIIHSIASRVTRRVLKRKHDNFLSSLAKYGVLRKLTAIIPPLIISALLPFAFDKRSEWFIIGDKITWVYFCVALIFSVKSCNQFQFCIIHHGTTNFTAHTPAGSHYTYSNHISSSFL